MDLCTSITCVRLTIFQLVRQVPLTTNQNGLNPVRHLVLIPSYKKLSPGLEYSQATSSLSSMPNPGSLVIVDMTVRNRCWAIIDHHLRKKGNVHFVDFEDKEV